MLERTKRRDREDINAIAAEPIKPHCSGVVGIHTSMPIAQAGVSASAGHLVPIKQMDLANGVSVRKRIRYLRQLLD